MAELSDSDVVHSKGRRRLQSVRLLGGDVPDSSRPRRSEVELTEARLFTNLATVQAVRNNPGGFFIV